MYDYLEGNFVEKRRQYLILDVGGIGYKLFVPLHINQDPFDLFSKIKLYIYMQQTEETINLYGFLDKKERDFFEKLISISGIGPKLAIKILSSVSYVTMVEMILLEDKEGLKKIQGLGPKTAIKVLVDLKDKLKDFPIYLDVSSKASTGSTRQLEFIIELKQALGTLGYKDFEIIKVIDLLSKEKKLTDLETSIKAALLILSPLKK